MKFAPSLVGNRIIATVLISFFIILTYVWYFVGIGTVRDNGTVFYILCFGDSITKGNTGKGAYHPYSLALKEHLNNKRLKRNYRDKFVVHNSGVNGERAHRSMELRLPTLLSKTKYNCVIILGGTNDLRVLLETNPPNIKYDVKLYKPILNALINLHKTVHKHGGKTIVVTIPGRLCEKMAYCKELKTVRMWLNDRLREFAMKNKNKVVLADLDKLMNMNNFSKFWSDDLHFTPDGYDEMGKIIFKAVSSSL